MSNLSDFIRSILAAAILRIVSEDKPDSKITSALGSDIAFKRALPFSTLSGSNLPFSLAPLTPALADRTSSKSDTLDMAAFFSASVALLIVFIACLDLTCLSALSISLRSSNMSSAFILFFLPITPPT